MTVTSPAQRTVSRLSPARLSAARLGRLAASVAASPDRWRAAVRFDPARRWYRQLELAGDYEIWLLSWLPGQETGFHDHGEAGGAFAIAAGELRERTAAVGRPQVASRVLGAGQFRSFGPRHVHDVGNTSAHPAVSVHAYSPPLTAMRRYQLTATGLLPTRTDAAGEAW